MEEDNVKYNLGSNDFGWCDSGNNNGKHGSSRERSIGIGWKRGDTVHYHDGHFIHVDRVDAGGKSQWFVGKNGNPHYKIEIKSRL